MFRWFYKKKTDDDFVLLDINDTNVTVTTESSSDVTPDTVSDVTSVPTDEYTCMFYDPPDLPYDSSHIEEIESTQDSLEIPTDTNSTDTILTKTVETDTTLSESILTDTSSEQLETDNYNFDDVEDITEEIKAMDIFYNDVKWNNTQLVAFTTGECEIAPHEELDFTEKSLRSMLNFFVQVDTMIDEMITFK